MPVLNADALSADPLGLEFLRDVLGTQAAAADPERRFPVDAWTPKAPSAPPSMTAPELAPEEFGPRCVEAVL